jgi:hypothetical protein
MGKKVYIKTALTGGGDTALDGIDGNLLNNGDIGIVTVSGVVYFYVLDHDNSSAESSPWVIQPDKNYGTKRWIMCWTSPGIYSTGSARLTILGVGQTVSTYGLVVQDNPVTANNFYVTDDGNVYIRSNCSALSYTDRTKYPESTKQAYDALDSMTAKNGQVDHGKLDPFIQGTPDKDKDGKETPTRDIGATLSCLVEAVKDMNARLLKLEKK